MKTKFFYLLYNLLGVRDSIFEDFYYTPQLKIEHYFRYSTEVLIVRVFYRSRSGGYHVKEFTDSMSSYSRKEDVQILISKITKLHSIIKISNEKQYDITWRKYERLDQTLS